MYSSAWYLTSKTLRHPFDFLMTKTRGATQSISTLIFNLPFLPRIPGRGNSTGRSLEEQS